MKWSIRHQSGIIGIGCEISEISICSMCARVAELADAQDLGSCAFMACGFDSRPSHCVVFQGKFINISSKI